MLGVIAVASGAVLVARVGILEPSASANASWCHIWQKNLFWGNREVAAVFWPVVHGLWGTLFILSLGGLLAISAWKLRQGWLPKRARKARRLGWWGCLLALAASVAALAGAAVHGDAPTCLQAAEIYLARWATLALVPTMGVLAAWLGARIPRPGPRPTSSGMAVSALVSAALWGTLYFLFWIAGAKESRMDWSVAPLATLGVVYMTSYALELRRCAKGWLATVDQIEYQYYRGDLEGLHEAWVLVGACNRACATLLLAYAALAVVAVVAPLAFFNGPRYPQLEAVQVGWNLVYLFFTVIHVGFITWLFWKAWRVNLLGLQTARQLLVRTAVESAVASNPPALMIGNTTIYGFEVALGGLFAPMGAMYGLIQRLV